MSAKSGIEWTDATWNPVTGCTKVSQGCKNCYAERMFPRVYGRCTGDPMAGERSSWFSDVHCHPERLDQPLRWRKPRRIFVNSMSDLFHEAVPFEFIKQVWDVIAQRLDHTFQILTKRPERLLEFHRWFAGGDDISITEWPRNVWLGVSVEDQATADERIPLLLQAPAAVRWISAEPLLGPINLDSDLIEGLHALGCGDKYCSCGDRGLDWVVTGGESGPKARPMHPDWVRSLRDQCQVTGMPFFFKQWGEWAPTSARPVIGKYTGGGLFIRRNGSHGCQGDWWFGDAAAMDKVGKKAAGRTLDGREWNKYPTC